MSKSPLEFLREAFARLGRGEEAADFEGSRGVGQRGETLAIDTLRERGYEIIDRNFRTPVGEIDIIAEEGGTLCFVEVKWRRGSALGHPAEAVTREKQRRIARAADWYLTKHRRRGAACRFDVVAIVAPENERPDVDIITDAFRGPFPPRRRR
jgi:putative endonuclease